MIAFVKWMPVMKYKVMASAHELGAAKPICIHARLPDWLEADAQTRGKAIITIIPKNNTRALPAEVPSANKTLCAVEKVVGRIGHL